LTAIQKQPQIFDSGRLPLTSAQDDKRSIFLFKEVTRK